MEALLAERDTALAQAKAELLHRDLLIETMRVQLARLRRMQFGTSSEKLSQEIAQLELALEELEAATVEATVASPVATRPKRPVPVRTLPAHLPREDVVAKHLAVPAFVLIAAGHSASWAKIAPSNLTSPR